MPWELGYFDGFKPGRVWILPLVSNSDSEFEGHEYIGLYPAVEKLPANMGPVNLGFTAGGTQRFDVSLMKVAKDATFHFSK